MGFSQSGSFSGLWYGHSDLRVVFQVTGLSLGACLFVDTGMDSGGVFFGTPGSFVNRSHVSHLFYKFFSKFLHI